MTEFKRHYHNYRSTPISVLTYKIDNGKGYINSTQVEVYYNDQKIGEYVRNYCSYAESTFHPFKVDDVWYALYSEDYTATRVAKLTETEFIDWCGEDAHSDGFCPVEIYVPRYKTVEFSFNDTSLECKHFDNEYSDDEMDEYYTGIKDNKGQKYLGETYCKYGFVSGCIWGDDTSWKLRFIDLSDVHNKNITIEEKFGYFELPNNLKLRNCIINVDEDYFHLAQMRSFSLERNKFEEYY